MTSLLIMAGGFLKTMSNEKDKPKVGFPQQKTFRFRDGESIEQMDEIVNKWMEDKVLKEKITPFDCKISTHDSEIIYVYCYTKWVDAPKK